MNNWHGKHPTPYDFFYSINGASGKDLNWFWNRWFIGWQYPDMAIKNVTAAKNGAVITVQNKGGLPLPISLKIISSTGKETILKSTAEVWKDGRKQTPIDANIPEGEISRIVLGNEFIPEKKPNDNVWNRK